MDKLRAVSASLELDEDKTRRVLRILYNDDEQYKQVLDSLGLNGGPEPSPAFEPEPGGNSATGDPLKDDFIADFDDEFPNATTGMGVGAELPPEPNPPVPLTEEVEEDMVEVPKFIHHILEHAADRGQEFNRTFTPQEKQEFNAQFELLLKYINVIFDNPLAEHFQTIDVITALLIAAKRRLPYVCAEAIMGRKPEVTVNEGTGKRVRNY